MTQYKLIKIYPGHALGEIHTADKSTKWYGTNFYNAYPEFWKKVDNPLFITEDGVKGYEGDTYWFTTEQFTINKDIAFKNGYRIGKCFSTLEKLEEYILFNKPILSLNDILNAWETNEYLQNIDDYKQSPLFNNFKKAAENKLNPKSKGILAQEYINNIETFYTEVKYSLKK